MRFDDWMRGTNPTEGIVHCIGDEVIAFDAMHKFFRGISKDKRSFIDKPTDVASVVQPGLATALWNPSFAPSQLAYENSMYQPNPLVFVYWGEQSKKIENELDVTWPSSVEKQISIVMAWARESYKLPMQATAASLLARKSRTTYRIRQFLRMAALAAPNAEVTTQGIEAVIQEEPVLGNPFYAIIEGNLRKVYNWILNEPKATPSYFADCIAKLTTIVLVENDSDIPAIREALGIPGFMWRSVGEASVKWGIPQLNSLETFARSLRYNQEWRERLVIKLHLTVRSCGENT